MISAFIWMALFSYGQVPDSCKDQLNKQSWPKDCFIAIQLDQKGLDSLFQELENWCSRNSSLVIDKRNYNFLELDKLPSSCQSLIVYSQKVHLLRRKYGI